jgi:hypothetical protein
MADSIANPGAHPPNLTQSDTAGRVRKGAVPLRRRPRRGRRPAGRARAGARSGESGWRGRGRGTRTRCSPRTGRDGPLGNFPMNALSD